MRRKDGFTLIELLIVVAIIAILAAIAVPNFLEARTRALVSRAESDMRTLAVGMESYYVDNGGYPASYSNSPLGGSSSTADHRLLSTPISYLSDGRFEDQFRKFESARTYRLYAVGYQSGSASYSAYPHDAWMTWSYGPDVTTQTGGYRTYSTVLANEALNPPKLGTGTKTNYPSVPNDTSGVNGMRYDPTNGTISIGDIYRFEGLAKSR